MPDGPRYEDDFYAWTQHQAEVLRSMPVSDNRFDREHVAEEIEDLGKSERDAVRSQIRRIIEHLLKLAYSPGRATALRLDASDRRCARGAGRQADPHLAARCREQRSKSCTRTADDARPWRFARYGEQDAAQSIPREMPLFARRDLSAGLVPGFPEP